MHRSWCLVLLLTACTTGANPAVVDDSLVARGASMVAQRGCAGCHDPGDGSLSGQTTPRPGTMAYGANLTRDEQTGVGSWSDDVIVRAIRTGVDDQMAPLCPPMPHFSTMGDGEARAIVAYLRSLPPVKNDRIPPSSCPPLKSP